MSDKKQINFDADSVLQPQIESAYQKAQTKDKNLLKDDFYRTVFQIGLSEFEKTQLLNQL